MRRIQVMSACAFAALCFISGCGNEPKLVSNQTATANAGAQSGQPAQTATSSSSSAPSRPSMGEAIDTSEYDAKIKRLEEETKKKPNDVGLKKQLAQAYLERGNALTQARQYQAALGDYRRTLRYDPDNKEARYWSDTIIGIMKQMNRELPAEGAEPTPLPMPKKQ